MTEPLDIVNRYHRAWTSGDVDSAMELVADNITCRAPGVDLTGKTQYREFIAGFAPALTGLQDAESATSMLALAQRVHDEYVRDGEEQAAKIIADANAERDAIISDAQKQKDSLLSQLDQERELLENKINGVRTFEAEYRSNLRNHLETLLKEVDNGEN